MGSLGKKIRKSAAQQNIAIAEETESAEGELLHSFDLTENIEASLNKEAEQRRKNRNKNKARRRRLRKATTH